MLDKADLKILEILQENAKTCNVDIAKQIGKAPSATLERIRKLEESGVIKGYKTLLNQKKLGLSLTAFILVRPDEGAYSRDLEQEISGFPEVLEIHLIAGEDCYLLKVVAGATESLAEIITKRFSNMKCKVTTKTTIVLETLKENSSLPLDFTPD